MHVAKYHFFFRVGQGTGFELTQCRNLGFVNTNGPEVSLRILRTQYQAQHQNFSDFLSSSFSTGEGGGMNTGYLGKFEFIEAF